MSIMKKKMNLGMKILLGLVLGIIVGAIFWAAMGAETAGSFTAKYIKPFGDIFVNLLKFIVVPLVLLSIMDGVIQMGDIKKVGKIGWKTVAYFLVTTAIACVIGLVQGQLPDAGAGRGRGIPGQEREPHGHHRQHLPEQLY